MWTAAAMAVYRIVVIGWKRWACTFRAHIMPTIYDYAMLFFFPVFFFLFFVEIFRLRRNLSLSLSHSLYHSAFSVSVCIRCLSRFVTIAIIFLFGFFFFTKINDYASNVSLKSGRRRRRQLFIGSLVAATVARASAPWRQYVDPNSGPSVIRVHFYTVFIVRANVALMNCCAGGRTSSSEWPRHTTRKRENDWECKIQRRRGRKIESHL